MRCSWWCRARLVVSPGEGWGPWGSPGAGVPCEHAAFTSRGLCWGLPGGHWALALWWWQQHRGVRAPQAPSAHHAASVPAFGRAPTAPTCKTTPRVNTGAWKCPEESGSSPPEPLGHDPHHKNTTRGRPRLTSPHTIMAAAPSPHSEPLPAFFPLGCPLASWRRRWALIGRRGCSSPAARLWPAHRAHLSEATGGKWRQHRVRKRGRTGPWRGPVWGRRPWGPLFHPGVSIFHPGACFCEPNAGLAMKAPGLRPLWGGPTRLMVPPQPLPPSQPPCRGRVPGAVPVLDWAPLGPMVGSVVIRLRGVWSVASVRMCKKKRPPCWLKPSRSSPNHLFVCPLLLNFRLCASNVSFNALTH